MRHDENETFFLVSRNNSKHFFSRIFVFFFSFAKRSKLGKTVMFPTVSNFAKLKKYETVNPYIDLWIGPTIFITVRHGRIAGGQPPDCCVWGGDRLYLPPF